MWSIGEKRLQIFLPCPLNAHTPPLLHVAHAATTTSFLWSPVTSPITGEPKIGPLSTTGQPRTGEPSSRWNARSEFVASASPDGPVPVPTTTDMRPLPSRSPIAGLDWKIWCWQRDHITCGPDGVTRIARSTPAQLHDPHGPPGLASPPRKMSIFPVWLVS